MSSVGEEFPKQQARVRALLGEYRALGAAGTFGATMIEAALKRADAAAISGDPIAILGSYQELKDFQ